MAVSEIATVWDAGITGVRLALELVPTNPLLVLLYSTAAMASIWNAVRYGSARTADVKTIGNAVREWHSRGV